MLTADHPLPRESSPKTRFGSYLVIRELRSGALSSIYLGREEGGKKEVAIKLFHPPASTTLRRALSLEGFVAEAEIQRAAANSRAIAPVFDVGATEDGCYQVRPYYRS